MTTTTTHRSTAAAITLSFLICSMCMGQASFTEDFESNGLNGTEMGPQNLIDRGWEFRNESDPATGSAFFNGDGFGGEPFDGTGYLGASSLATDWFGGELDSWAILPDIQNQIAGDLVTLWVLGGGAFSSQTSFEILYSAGVDTGTGFGIDGRGDFTQELHATSLPVSESGYTRIQVPVPGDGRIALRFRSPFIMSAFGNGAYFSIDTLSVNADASDPCSISIPDAGETVVWAAADGPFVVCQNLVIPAGGRVEIEAGATVDFSGGTLLVEGELVAAGTDLNPITLTGQSGFSTGLEFNLGGSGELSNTTISTTVDVNGTFSSLILTDSNIIQSGQITGIGGLVSVDGCLFDGGSLGNFWSIAGTIRLTNSDFINGGSAAVAGLLYLDHVTIDGGMLRIAGESTAHPILLDNISVTNNTAGPGIKMYGPNFLIGDNVVLSGNQYPLEMDFDGAGLLPGSKLPLTGNTFNHIPVESFPFAQNRHWADTGIPYVIGDFADNRGGSMIIEAGANLKFLPNAGSFIIGSANLELNGTKEKPIVLESFSPSQRWFGLKWVDVFDAKARHTIFDGGQITAQSDGGVLDLVHSTVQNSLEGTASVTGGIVRLYGSKIINNDVGMVTTTSGRIEADGFIAPSIFEGNNVAVEYNNTNSLPFLRNNWWGDASGPTNILHPTGTGDSVINVHPAAFSPFLSAPPAIDDEYPDIEMMPVYFTAQVGDKIILRWSSSDDIDVVEHRVEFAAHDFPNEFQTIAVLGGNEFTYEFTAPVVLPNNLYPTPSAIRIVAVDSAGQESWDKSVLRIPYQEDWTVVEQTIQSPIGSVRPHESIDVCWGPGGFASAFIMLDGIGLSDSAGGTTTGCLPIGATLPYSSSDTARIVVVTTFGAGGRLHYSFGDYFSIRPDTRFGDAAPAVEIRSPLAGSSYSGGSTIPINWTASDDESLRSFRIQASYDGGRTWHYVATDLPAEARSFSWVLPNSSGIGDVRVRLVAIDHRFQDSSSVSGSFEILAGSVCPADLTGDGTLDFFDISAFLTAFGNNDPIADFSGDGAFDFFDISAFLGAFSSGCP